MLNHICTTFVFIVALTKVDGESHGCNGEASNQYVYNKCQCLEFTITPQVFWAEAKKTCRDRGGQLVTIHESGKQKFIADILNKISTKDGVWLGMTKVDKRFQWIDDKLVSSGYDAWDDNEPDGSFLGLDFDCAVLHRDLGWKWKDFFCSVEPYSYICQYDIDCESGKEKNKSGLSTNEVIGIVVGGVIGVICFFALVFLMINCCRDAVRSKQRKEPTIHMRECETGSDYETDRCTDEPMIPPPEKAQFKENDLDRVNSTKPKKASLVMANVTVSATPDIVRGSISRQSTKISNLPKASKDQEETGKRESNASIEDNYLTANTDTGEAKSYGSVSGLDKLS